MKLENEYDLQVAIVAYIRFHYPTALLTASFGELQTTPYKRLKCYKKGYLAGEPDLKFNNLHNKYAGFVIELKSPTGKGKLSDKQKNVLSLYELNNYKCLVSNDYEEITAEIDDYMLGVRIKCPFCEFLSINSLNSHLKNFHKKI